MPFLCDRSCLRAATFPGQMPSLRPMNPFNGTLELAAGARNGVWNGGLRGIIERSGSTVVGSS